MKKFIFMTLIFSMMSCGNNINTEKSISEDSDTLGHDAMCTCDECSEEDDTLPEIEDNI